MAILEVHDGRGRVERVEISRDEPCILGSSPTCTIVIGDPAAAPIHGRIRWQKRRYKIDAGADVDAIEVNGKRLKKSTLYQGDEIRIGAARVFVISTEESRVAIPSDDKTRIQPAPKAFVPAGRSSSSGDGTGKATAKAPNLFESVSIDDVIEGREPARPEPLKRGRSRDSEPAKQATPKEPPQRERPASPSFWAWLKTRVLPRSEAPGAERVVGSPFVVGLAVTFIVLVLASFGTWKTIVKATSQKQFLKAFQSLDDGDYRNAIKQLDDFLTRFPEDPRSGKARVFKCLAKVRQFTSLTGASWENALQAAQTMVTEVGELDEYRDASTELAEQLVKTTEGLADRAKMTAQPESLTEAESALSLLREVAGNTFDSMITKSRIIDKLAQARAAIIKAQTRTRALTALNKALDGGSAARAYEARDGLVAAYPELATDRELVAGLVKANELIRKSVQFDPSQRPAETVPHADPLGEPTTLVLRLNPGTPPGGGSVVTAVADGLAFGLDGATGAPLWQVPVGLSSPFRPIPISGGDASSLVVDARYDELIRLDQRTGKPIWRQELGERAVDPPLLMGNEIIYALPSGKILFIDLNSGSLRGTLNLGRPLTRSPVADEGGTHIYVLGNEDCLFVIEREPISCVSVEYLGHEPGSVPCTPARVGRFLVVPENHTLTDGRWRVFVLDETGANLTARQTIPIAGWTWQTPTTAGSVLWSVSDRGEIVAQSIGLYDAELPFKPIAGIVADNTASGPAFALARSEREVWVASEHPSRIDLNPETGKLARAWTLAQVGPAVAPVQLVDRFAVFTQQAIDGPGIAVVAVEPQSGTVVWRTTLGAPWPVKFVAGPTPDMRETLGFSGSKFALTAEKLASGGFVEQPLSKPGNFRIPSIAASWVSCGETIVMIPDPYANHILTRKGDEPFRRIELPAPLGAAPIAWGKNVVIPASDGRVYLLDPITGEFAADPFVPRFDKAHPSHWLTPVLVDGDAIILADRDGQIRRLVKASKPRPRLNLTGESRLGKPIVAELASTGASILVATNDGKIRALATRDLSPIGTTDLTLPRTLGPVAVGDYLFIGDSSGKVIAFGKDGRKLWQSSLRSPAADAPAVHADAAWFLTKSGTVESFKLADGSALERLVLGILPAGAPEPVGSHLVIPSGLGSLRPVDPGKPEGKAKP